jgi:hypothetical protein
VKNTFYLQAANAAPFSKNRSVLEFENFIGWMKGAATSRQQHVAEEIINKLREVEAWQAKRFKEATQRNF